MPWQKKVHRNVKDRLFRFLFDKDKEALLQLYNALNGTNYQDSGMKLQAALNAAVDYCVAHGILDSTLREHRSEVLGMLLEEFDADKYERTIRMEGIQQGEEQGMQRGISRANRLTQLLLEQNRTDDLKRALEDSEYQDMLFREYDL